MKKFSELMYRLYFTSSQLGKAELLKNYFATTPDPDRGYTVALISGNLNIPSFKRKSIQELMYERVDPYLLRFSYDYVGDLSETIAYLWPDTDHVVGVLPTLGEVIETLYKIEKNGFKCYLTNLLNLSDDNQRWALLKLGLGSLRIGISSRSLKQILAQYGHKDIHEIESIWHILKPPYIDLFAWLENRAEKPSSQGKIYFHPVMLSHPLNETDSLNIPSSDFFAEWKYDGIRTQLICQQGKKVLFSRTGDDISHSFPDIINGLPEIGNIVLDGELVIKTEKDLGSFNQLQQRLNRKSPTQKLLKEAPAHLIIFDILFLEEEDLRQKTLLERRECLERWYKMYSIDRITLSPLLNFTHTADIAAMRQSVVTNPHHAIEGLMLKRKESPYIAGRPSNLWFKWKRDPFLIDAVLMYAQRGHGKRSSFYSDYTFGIWQGTQLLPIGKAYFGFTDAELKQLDTWVRKNTTNKFGPVREVEKLLTLEIAFDNIQRSNRHKAGYALRFPRVNRIRWDKPASEAGTLEELINLSPLISQNKSNRQE